MSYTELTDEQLHEEYLGDRGTSFDQTMLSLLRMGKLSSKLQSVVFDKELFSKAFDHPSISSENYEFYEILGDAVVNKSIVQYLARRFPQLQCHEGVRVLARLKINLVSKRVLAEFADSLGFWPFISATAEFRLTKKKPMLEDCFEAVMGLIEKQIDEKCCKMDKDGRPTSGGGYRVCYAIIQNILDSYRICGGLPAKMGIQVGKLKYKELVDPKTRLKELFDLKEHREQLGKLKYISNRDGQLCHTTVYARGGQHRRTQGDGWSLGQGTAALQADSQQAAAKVALTVLKTRGYSRALPAYYAKFCVNE